MFIFSKNQLLDELKLILLYQADAIAIAKGDQIAEQFIGQPKGKSHWFHQLSISSVDLSSFAIADDVSTGYEYGFNAIGSMDEIDYDRIHFYQASVLTLRHALDLKRFEEQQFMTPEGLFNQTADVITARIKLELLQRDTYTVRDLALLSNMSEGAVRNAISQKGPGGLAAIPGAKPVSVSMEEALRWLRSKRGFVASDDGRELVRDSVSQSLQTASSPNEFSKALGMAIDYAGGDEKLGKALGWSTGILSSWRQGTMDFDITRARQLGRALNLDEAAFAGKTLEISIRRGGHHDEH